MTAQAAGPWRQGPNSMAQAAGPHGPGGRAQAAGPRRQGPSSKHAHRKQRHGGRGRCACRQSDSGCLPRHCAAERRRRQRSPARPGETQRSAKKARKIATTGALKIRFSKSCRLDPPKGQTPLHEEGRGATKFDFRNHDAWTPQRSRHPSTRSGRGP